MKRLIIAAMLSVLAVSCKVVDPYESNHMTDRNISVLCSNIFEDKVYDNVRLFYNAFEIASFLDADAEEKVAAKYDIIRTGLSGKDGKYVYDYDDYEFSADTLFGPGALWKVSPFYHRSLTMTGMSEDSWQVKVNDGTVIDIVLSEEGEGVMVLEMDVNGVKTEESPYTGSFSGKGLKVRIDHAKIGVIDSIAFSGSMLFEFRNGSTLLKSCNMTLSPGMTTVFEIF